MSHSPMRSSLGPLVLQELLCDGDAAFFGFFLAVLEQHRLPVGTPGFLGMGVPGPLLREAAVWPCSASIAACYTWLCYWALGAALRRLGLGVHGTRIDVLKSEAQGDPCTEHRW